MAERSVDEEAKRIARILEKRGFAPDKIKKKVDEYKNRPKEDISVIRKSNESLDNWKKRLLKKYEKDTSGKFVRKQPAQVIPGIQRLSQEEKKLDKEKRETAKAQQKTAVIQKKVELEKERGLRNPFLKFGQRLNNISQEPTGRLMFFFAIVLWIFDMALGFSGINYEFFLNIFRNPSSAGSLIRIAWNVITLFIFGFIIWRIIFNRPEKNELIALGLMLETFNIVFSLGGFNLMLLAHLVFSTCFLLFVLLPYYTYQGKKQLAYWYTMGFIIIDFFLFPYLSYYYTKTSNIRGAFPVWVVITLYYTLKLKRSRLLGFVSFFLIMFYLFAFAQPLFGGLDVGLAGMQTENMGFKAIGGIGAKAFANAKLAFKNVGKGIQESYNESISYATGDYYTGRVDRNVKEPLGVYITNIETADPEVYEDEAIEIWAILRAKSIEEPIDSIKVQCIADKDTIKEKPGKSKVSEFNNFIDEEEDIDCKFEENDLEAGSHLITFTAEFDFTTLAYLKTYFIDDERLKALKREGIDVFKEYGITDKNPIAVYTNGPVGIGMETKTPPIGISKDYDSTPKFGITIENKWKGKITEIKDLIIYLPEGIELDDNCDEAFEKIETREYILDGYTAYKMIDAVKESKEWKDIELYKSRNCRLNIKDRNKILGDTPISTKYIKARIKYVYNSQESININVQTPKGFNVYFEPKKPSMKDEIKCVASHSDAYVIMAPFYIYKEKEGYVDEEERWDEIVNIEVECGSKENKCEYPIPKAGLKRGDKIKCKVYKAKLSNNVEETDSAVVEIQNSAPEITAFFEPKNAPADKDLKCVGVIKDADGDNEFKMIYEVKNNNERLSYDKLETKWINNQFEILIKKENFKEGDKTECKMTVKDIPSKGESKYSEPKEITIIIGKSTETTTTGSGGTGTSSNLYADCNLEENHGHACRGSTKRNCYYYKDKKIGECLTECEFLGKTGTHPKIKDSWKCACNKASWKEQCEDESFLTCVTGHCPEDMNMYCCDMVGLLG